MELPRDFRLLTPGKYVYGIEMTNMFPITFMCVCVCITTSPYIIVTFPALTNWTFRSIRPRNNFKSVYCSQSMKLVKDLDLVKIPNDECGFYTAAEFFFIVTC